MPCSRQGICSASWPPDHETTACTTEAVLLLAQMVTSLLRLGRYWDRRRLDVQWIIMHLSNDDWALSGRVVYTSTMGAFVVGVISVGNKGGGAHEGLVVCVATMEAWDEGFEGAPETWSRYRHSPTFRSGSGDT